MAAKHTANYQLNQWEPTDRILCTDFNADNAKIDAALKAAADLAASAQAAAAGSGNCQIVTGTYTGDGLSGSSHPNTLTFSGKPLLVIVHSVERYNTASERMVLVNGASWGFSEHVNNYNSLVTWGDTSVSWYDPDENYIRQMNISNRKYVYVALMAAS